jgi:hypothetical protein
MRIASLFAGLLVTLVARTAHADPADSAKAEALFRQGRAAAEAGNYAVACPKFEESYRLEPAPGTLLNLGDCEENQGQLVRAWQHFRQLHDELPASDRRKSLADRRAKAALVRAPKLRVVLASAVPATVVRDDAVLDRASLGVRVPVEPGKHVIVVSAAGRRDNHYEVLVGDGEDKEIAVAVGEPDSKPPVLHREAMHAPSSDGSARRTTTIVLGGVGLASVATGGALGVFAAAELANTRPATQLQTPLVVGTVFIGAGIVLLGTALIVALTGDHSRTWGQF